MKMRFRYIHPNKKHLLQKPTHLPQYNTPGFFKKMKNARSENTRRES
jgi:hypothetical protein